MSIKAHIPNSITSLNLLSGAVAVCFSFYGEFRAALLCMLAAAVFDFLDGFTARLLHSYSPMGKELDSLADMVSFGLAPAFIMFNKLLHIWDIGFMDIFSLGNCAIYCISLAATLMIAVFSALRLGKFNIDTRQSENFIGLATPSNALLIGALVCASAEYEGVNRILSSSWALIPLLSLLLSLLLVSEIPMFSFKFKSLDWKDNSIRFLFAAWVAVLGCATLIFRLDWSIWIAAIFLSYIAVNVVQFLFKKGSAT